MATLGTDLDFVELSLASEPSPDQQWAVDASGVHRVLWFPTRDRLNAPQGDTERHRIAQGLLGYNVMRTQAVKNINTLAVGTRRWIERQLPHAYPPVFDSNTNPEVRPWQFAQSISKCEVITRHSAGMDGPARDGGPRDRDGSKFYVNYRTLPYDLREDSEMLAGVGPLATGGDSGEWVARPGGEELAPQPDEGLALGDGWINTRYIIKNEEDRSALLTLPQGTLRFLSVDENGKQAPVPSGFPFTNVKIDVTYEWCLVPIAAIPRQAIANALNCVNDATFDGFDEFTLLFRGYRIMNRRGPFGDWLCNIVYGFSYRPNYDFTIRGRGTTSQAKGWNAFPRTFNGELAYDFVVGGWGQFGVPKVPYPPADMTALFRPDQDMPEL